MERFHEDKQLCLTKLCEFLNTTRSGVDIASIVYEKIHLSEEHPEWYDEQAVISFRDRDSIICVDITGDSGTEMAKDIFKKIS